MKNNNYILFAVLLVLMSCKKNNSNPENNTFKSITITTPGMYFQPSTLTCNIGDTIVFDLGLTHNALEVNEVNFNNNNATYMDDGFYFDFGETGYLIPTESKTYYYVCAPHLPDMKGIIIVNQFRIYNIPYKTQKLQEQ